MGFRSARKAAGLTLEQAGLRLGVSAAAISMWETGKAMPEARRLIDIAKAYDCTVDELLRNDEAGK